MIPLYKYLKKIEVIIFLFIILFILYLIINKIYNCTFFIKIEKRIL